LGFSWREVKEETNLDILPDKEHSFTFDYPNGKITIYAFKTKLLCGDIKLDKKHTDFKWISKDNWKDLNYSLSTQAFLTEYFQNDN
jgi:8-oxo-dGTP pyrophosphatase MutT (NUDIX family)